jgi:hypothetical protein
MEGKPDPILEAFLGEDVTGWKSGLQREFADVVSLAKQANVVCNDLVYSLAIPRGDLSKLVVSMLFSRGLRLFQASILLSWHCLHYESHVPLRSMLEAMFKACAICKDPGLAQKYVDQDQRHRWQSIQALARMKDRSELGMEADLLQQIEELRASPKPKLERYEGEPWWWADRAEMNGVYDSAYVLASSHVHLNPRSIERALTLDGEGDVADIEFGPSRTDYMENQMAATEMLLLFAGRVAEFFDLENSEIEATKRRFFDVARQVKYGSLESS